jgi:hypothetical protein
MGLLPITEKGKPVTCQADWPLFYMNDFSRLGLVVNQLSEAVTALQMSGFTVHEDERGVLLDISGSDPLNKVFQTLASHHLEYETADLVSCVYQG